MFYVAVKKITPKFTVKTPIEILKKETVDKNFKGSAKKWEQMKDNN